MAYLSTMKSRCATADLHFHFSREQCAGAMKHCWRHRRSKPDNPIGGLPSSLPHPCTWIHGVKLDAHPPPIKASLLKSSYTHQVSTWIQELYNEIPTMECEKQLIFEDAHAKCKSKYTIFLRRIRKGKALPHNAFPPKFVAYCIRWIHGSPEELMEIWNAWDYEFLNYRNANLVGDENSI